MSDYISKSALLEDIKDYQMDIVSKATAMKVIRNQPTLDETEIIRMAFERVVERLEEYRNFEDHDSLDRQCIDRTIEIVKEECGINE